MTDGILAGEKESTAGGIGSFLLFALGGAEEGREGGWEEWEG